MKRTSPRKKRRAAARGRIKGGVKPERSPRMAKTRTAGLSTRSAVIGCLRKLTGDPGLDPGPQATVEGLGVSRTGLGTCLNTALSLAGDDRYKGDEIGGDWTVQDVINDADGRRHTLSP